MFKFGLKPRVSLTPALPHWSAAQTILGTGGSPAPADFDHAASLPADLGQMNNDQVGCCVFAAEYHKIQLVTKAARGIEITEPDNRIIQGYSELTGYIPGNLATDQGTDMAEFMAYLVKTGVPIDPAPAPHVRHKALAALEVDARIANDVIAAIYQCGGCHCGFTVPGYIMEGTEPSMIWDVQTTGDQSPAGGHDVYLTGHHADGTYNVISWGSHEYLMTQAFLDKYVTMIIATADPSWIATSGMTPLGLTVEELEQMMVGFGHV